MDMNGPLLKLYTIEREIFCFRQPKIKTQMFGIQLMENDLEHTMDMVSSGSLPTGGHNCSVGGGGITFYLAFNLICKSINYVQF